MTEFFVEQFTAMTEGMKYFMTFLISMLPIIEIRGAAPVGIALGLNEVWVYVVSVIGNMLPIPFIVMFARTVINWLKSKGFFKKITGWLERKVEKNKDKILKYEKWGLFIFVAIPLPGTGAWTGALVASFLDMRLKNCFVPIFAGVVTAGVIMLGGSLIVRYLVV